MDSKGLLMLGLWVIVGLLVKDLITGEIKVGIGSK